MRTGIELTVGNLGADVVRNVGLGDTVHHIRTDGTHEVTVNGGEGTAGKGPLFGRVVGCFFSLWLHNCIRRQKVDSRSRGSVCWR